MLRDDLDRWDEVGGGGREIQEGGWLCVYVCVYIYIYIYKDIYIHTYIELIHTVAQQK